MHTYILYTLVNKITRRPECHLRIYRVLCSGSDGCCRGIIILYIILLLRYGNIAVRFYFLSRYQ